MPSAREALLDAAYEALVECPWPTVRMVDVAAAAGVSRQTLYNEFGSKDGLARALVRREADAYLQGVERLLAAPTPPERGLAAVAEWTVTEATARPLLRALLTGCWTERLPAPRPTRAGGRRPAVPAQRRADAGTPTPVELLAQARGRAAPLIGAERAPHSCEVVLRLALSYVVAPEGRGSSGLPLNTAVAGVRTGPPEERCGS